MPENISNQSSKLRANNWVEIYDESRAAFNTHSQIKFKDAMSKSILCNYSDAYILVITQEMLMKTWYLKIVYQLLITKVKQTMLNVYLIIS